ncbi:MAG: hypothetical protein Q9160_007065, partial [Pyrenula sp. 1 TL-2023]
MTAFHANHELELHLATHANDEIGVQKILDSPTGRQAQLDSIDPANGRTPLFTACIKGLAPIAKLFLEAGAKQNVIDLAGWTSKEHAVFRGHLNVAKLFPRQEEAFSALLKPEKRHLVDYQRQSNTNQVFIYLGPSNARSSLAPVAIDMHDVGFNKETGCLAQVGVRVKSQGMNHGSFADIPLPISETMVNRPFVFTTDDIDKAILEFEIYRRLSSAYEDAQARPAFGTATALLKGLRGNLSPKHESLTRHFTIPVLENGTMSCIGSITFSVLIVTPFHAQDPLPKRSLGFWRRNGVCSIVGHRGSGANSTSHTVLQIGENTLQSFHTATKRGVSGVEFDVQLTKDYRTVLYHDFLVKEIGGDIPVHELTFDQFQHLSRSQAPKTDLLSSSEQRYIERAHPDITNRSRPRRNSLNAYDHSRIHDLLHRISHTNEGLLGNNIKGNIRGAAIQEPSTTLEALLVLLPTHLDFDIEIKYPMLWEAEDRGMEFSAIELNTYVDTILYTLLRHCGSGGRNITLTSFSQEVCIALACKQRSFPILMINKAGTVPTGDIRAGSLKGAIDFATAWNLDGVVVRADPFVMCPRLLAYAKDTGLVVASYGEMNNEPECAK